MDVPRKDARWLRQSSVFTLVRGVVDEADVTAGRVAVIAPKGFMEEATSENVIAGATRAVVDGGTVQRRSRRP